MVLSNRTGTYGRSPSNVDGVFIVKKAFARQNRDAYNSIWRGSRPASRGQVPLLAVLFRGRAEEIASTKGEITSPKGDTSAPGD